MKVFVLITPLVIFFLYLVSWSFNLHFFNKRKKTVEKLRNVRAKGNKIKKRTIDCTKDYWYNLRELEDKKENEDFEKYYHYFIGVDQGVHDLILEMYDCGIVRIDELELIAYGSNRLKSVDLSFLEEMEREIEQESENKVIGQRNKNLGKNGDSTHQNEIDPVLEEKTSKSVFQIGGAFNVTDSDILQAARDLKDNDPGITDIHGTLSDGVEKVIAAVESAKKKEMEEKEPIIPKKEKSVEKAREDRARTMNAEVRKKLYEKWVGYVFELYEMIKINANEDTKHKIRKALMDYGYNDVDVLLEGPD